jgi:hypothetical protein
MKLTRVHPFSVIAGAAIAGITFVSMGQSPPPSSGATYEYRIMSDISETEVKRLANDDWEFAGYLGTSTKGFGIDETLWKKRAK